MSLWPEKPTGSHQMEGEFIEFAKIILRILYQFLSPSSLFPFFFSSPFPFFLLCLFCLEFCFYLKVGPNPLLELWNQ